MTQTEITLQRIEQVLPQWSCLQLEIALSIAAFGHEQISAQSVGAAFWSFVEHG